MCEGSFLPSSFGPHQKHTEFESSLRSYPINSFAFFAKRRELFPSHVGAGALTRPGGDFFCAAEGNLPSHTCHSEERRDESLLSYTCRIRFSGEESAFCRAAPSFSRFLRKGGDLLKPRRRRCPHLPNTLPLSVVILRKRSPSPREGVPTKGLSLPAASEAETASLILPKGKRRETPSVSPPRSLTYLSFRGAPRREPALSYRSEEHTSELQSPDHLVCRLLLEKKKI